MSTNQTDKLAYFIWKQLNEVWYLQGFNAEHLDLVMQPVYSQIKWTLQDMDTAFLNREDMDAKNPFKIKWQEFHEKYGGLIYRLGRDELEKALTTFSQDSDSIRSTFSYYEEIENRLGVRLANHGDDFSSILPDFYYVPLPTAEDFFFEYFLSTKLRYEVVHPVKFAQWASTDERWQKLTSELVPY